MEWNNAKWIGLSSEQIRAQKIYAGEESNHFVYFRTTAVISGNAALNILITASSRYRLWVNGRAVLSGPCKGDRFRHYYEEVELTPYLTAGENVFAVQVLYVNPDRVDEQYSDNGTLVGICGPAAGHRFCLEGTICEQGLPDREISTGIADWRCFYEDAFRLHEKEINYNLGAITEEIDFRKACHGWKYADFDDSGWYPAQAMHQAVSSEFEKAVGFLPRLPLVPRPIPLLCEDPGWLTEVLEDSGADGDRKAAVINAAATVGAAVTVGAAAAVSSASADDAAAGSDGFRVGAHDTREILFHAGELMSAYPAYRFRGGAGAAVTFTYFEKFTDAEGIEISWRQRNRVLPDGSLPEIYLGGQVDSVILEDGDLTYEPFWMRTFRFVKIRIETADSGLVMDLPYYQKTGYPLIADKAENEFDALWKKQIYEISLRTLKNCMMETYMDCPFYEQMQFIMDTRLQVLFNHCVSSDLRLARKALEDFHCSMQPDGLIHGKYPSAYPQIISTFSLYYIFMIREYYEMTQDAEVLRLYRGDVDRILDYFERQQDADGWIGKLGYWAFVDWKDEWGGSGAPEGSSIVMLMYAYALKDGAAIWRASGRPAVAEEYDLRRTRINRLVIEKCWNEERQLLSDTPGGTTWSQHAQSWGVLCGALTGESAVQAMQHALNDPDMITCSLACSYEFFRALEQCGLYGNVKDRLAPWIRLLDLDVTTCPEVPVGGRSACHAWSALPLYELTKRRNERETLTK